jgi:hypothetical protein
MYSRRVLGVEASVPLRSVYTPRRQAESNLPSCRSTQDDPQSILPARMLLLMAVNFWDHKGHLIGFEVLFAFMQKRVLRS